MTSHETNRDPSTRERKVLGAALCALGGAMALMIWYQPVSLMLVSWVSAAAWCASMLFNRDEPLRRQWKGVIVPLVSGLVYAIVRTCGSPQTVAIAAAVALVALGLFVWFRDEFGRSFYKTWSLLFLPLAWSVSTLLLILVYYGVLTPIGLALRIVGRDPLHRKFDRDATTYWVKRAEVVDPKRYFRQF